MRAAYFFPSAPSTSDILSRRTAGIVEQF